jgi:hypothetical protein
VCDTRSLQRGGFFVGGWLREFIRQGSSPAHNEAGNGVGFENSGQNGFGTRIMRG